VIEDACQAHGAIYKNRPVGALGHAGCFSFYPGKNLGAYGEGGMVTTNDAGMQKTMRMLRDWGQEKKYYHVLKGFNYRMEGFQGAILRVKLRHLAAWSEARRERATAYDRLLAGNELVQAPAAPANGKHVYHIYAVRTNDRAGLMRTLQANGIGTGIHYPIPVHLQEAHADLGYKKGDFPESERAADQVLSLPMFPELAITDVEVVAAAITQETYVG
jgi:dTDP-4-amino-4,6-dideoxygalactose transaminase